MKFGISTFVTDDGIDTVSLARAIEERGFDFTSRGRTHPYSGEPGVRLSAGWRAAVDLLPDPGPVRDVGRGCGGDLEHRVVHRDRPADPARSDHHRKRGRQHRPDLRWPLRLRRGRRLEYRGVARSRHGPEDARRAARRTHRSHQGVVDRPNPPSTTASTSTSTPPYLRPKPVQQPHPPIFIGGDSDATVKRVIRHDAGWISNPLPVERLKKRIDQMRDGTGRDVPLAMFGTPGARLLARHGRPGFRPVALLLPTMPDGRVAAIARRIRRQSRRIPRLYP